jgi:hypothetical protein
VRIDIRNKKHVGFAVGFKAYDGEREIKDVVWADVGKGEYGQTRRTSAGKLAINSAGDGIIIDTKRGNIELRCR